MQLLKGFASKRQHEEIMSQVDALEAFSRNRNSVVFGDQKNNLMA